MTRLSAMRTYFAYEYTYTTMSRNIAISDEVYQKLAREKGDRSFSEVIEDHLESGHDIADVAGEGIFGPDTHEEIKADIRSLSEGTIERPNE